MMPSHRHAAPSGPWPFLDVSDTIDEIQLETTVQPRRQTHESEMEYPFNNETDNWRKYPQSLFPNWTQEQQKKSGVAHLIRSSRVGYRSRFGNRIVARQECSVYRLIMLKSGRFHPDSSVNPGWKIPTVEGEEKEDLFWKALTEPTFPDTRCQMFFIDSLSGHVLQMFGARFTIDPFFFSSSVNWIPSRYCEQAIPGRSDHITFTLTYVMMRPLSDSDDEFDDSNAKFNAVPMYLQEQRVIDTHSPLFLQSSNRVVVHDLMGVHAVRHGPEHHNPSTIITYVPPIKDPSHQSTTASTLNSRILATGNSVHWSDLYKATGDPTLHILAELWFPLYAWDETLEFVTTEVIWLEAHTLSAIQTPHAPAPATSASTDGNPRAQKAEYVQEQDSHEQTYMHTHQLHVMRAHLLHYKDLLEDYTKTVEFLMETPHPGMSSQIVFLRECKSLLSSLDRLESTRAMLNARVGNAMDLAFNSVIIEDSKRMQALTEAALRDSAAMKQIAYITMVYLPASFCATVFGMNTGELLGDGETSARLSYYFAIAMPLTLLTIWIMTLFYRGEKRRRDIEQPPELRHLLKWKNISVVTARFLAQALARKLVYPIVLLFKALSFTPRSPRQRRAQEEREWLDAHTMSRYASARSSMRSPRTPRGGRSGRSSVYAIFADTTVPDVDVIELEETPR